MGRREPVGMAKDVDFQMPVIYVMLKLTIQVATQQQELILHELQQLQRWAQYKLSQN